MATGGSVSSSFTSANPVNWNEVDANLGKADGAYHVEDAVKVADMPLKDVERQLNSAVNEAGISSSPPITLVLICKVH